MNTSGTISMIKRIAPFVKEIKITQTAYDSLAVELSHIQHFGGNGPISKPSLLYVLYEGIKVSEFKEKKES